MDSETHCVVLVRTMPRLNLLHHSFSWVLLVVHRWHGGRSIFFALPALEFISFCWLCEAYGYGHGGPPFGCHGHAFGSFNESDDVEDEEHMCPPFSEELGPLGPPMGNPYMHPMGVPPYSCSPWCARVYGVCVSLLKELVPRSHPISMAVSSWNANFCPLPERISCDRSWWELSSVRPHPAAFSGCALGEAPQRALFRQKLCVFLRSAP